MNVISAKTALRRLAVIAAATLALGTVTALPAAAHTRLISSSPAADAKAAPVSEVSMVFSDQISNAKVLIKDAAGREVQSGPAELQGTNVVQRLAAPTAAGAHTVAYRVVGEDGHPIEGRFGFTITGAGDEGADAGAELTPAAEPSPEDAGAPVPAEEADGPSWLLIGGGVLVLAAIAGGVLLLLRRRGAKGAEPAETAAETATAGGSRGD